MTIRALVHDLSLVVAGASVVIGAGLVLMLARSVAPVTLGVDLHTYEGAARSWLAGDGFYHARQLAGPYIVQGGSPSYTGDILYPPTALLLFLPFLVLPDVLWWAIPVALVGWSLYRLRPAAWAWPVMVLAVLWPPSLQAIIDGNPVIWIAAAVALGVVYGWPSVFVLLKPSLAPFALIGIRRRSWWSALAGLVLVSVPFAPLWADWVRVVLDGRGSDLFYSAQQVPLLMLPVVAWVGRQATTSSPAR